MNTEKLLELADFLDTLEPKQFNYNKYITEGNEECGTVCCAVGWIPAVFEDSVLEWGRSYTAGEFIYLEPVDPLSSVSSATMKLFDITYEEYGYLFEPNVNENPLDCDATHTEVANHIRAFVDQENGLVPLESNRSP